MFRLNDKSVVLRAASQGLVFEPDSRIVQVQKRRNLPAGDLRAPVCEILYVLFIYRTCMHLEDIRHLRLVHETVDGSIQLTGKKGSQCQKRGGGRNEENRSQRSQRLAADAAEGKTGDHTVLFSSCRTGRSGSRQRAVTDSRIPAIRITRADPRPTEICRVAASPSAKVPARV